jgi:hypothetical protein
MIIELNARIIDFKKRGNVVRFYLNNKDSVLPEYTGDDWNDRPYEHNAGPVYDEYVSHIVDVAFPLDCIVLEPADDWRYNDNTSYSKDDFKAHKTPCIIVLPPEIVKQDYLNADNYSFYKSSKHVHAIYFGDEVKQITACKYATIIKFGRKESFNV